MNEIQLKLCDIQGRLFELSVDRQLGSAGFIKTFMNSETKHALGMAVDINPLYNPYIKEVEGRLSIEPDNAVYYVDRNKSFPHKIDHDDMCYKLFIGHGFEWGGDWMDSKDYQHFEME